MADNLSEKKYPRLALPIGRIKILKFLYISLIISIVLILVVGGTYFYLKNSKKLVKKPIKSSEVVNNKAMTSKAGGSTRLSSTDVLEISKKLVDVTDKQRDERDVYSESEICQNGSCQNNFSSNRSGFSVMDGKVRLQKEIEQGIIDDLKKYADRNVVQVIQSNYLLCNFLYDLYNYPNASEEVKNLTDKICFDVQYEFTKEDVDLVYSNKTTNTTDLLNQDLQKLDSILIKKETVSSTISDNFEITKKYSYFVSEFATRYKWKNNDEDYRGFLFLLDKFLDLYNNSNNEFWNGEGCALAMGLIDMADVKQIPEFKKYGQLIYSRDFVEKDINKMTVRHMLTCGLLADKLNDKESVNKIINKISTTYYNKDKNMVSSNNKDSLVQIYDVKNNGMFLILLSSVNVSE